ncbi:MAG: serine hydrolase [Actinomycetes bacterium]
MGKGRHSRPAKHPKLTRILLITASGSVLALTLALNLRVTKTQADPLVVPLVTTTTIPSNPFQDAAVATFLASRTNIVTASVCDLRTGRIYNYNPNVPLPTASMVKIDILAALLHKNAKLGRSLTASDKATAVLMVEHSDNDAATILFNELGGPTALNAFNRSIGMTQTTSQWDWGATMTTPYDEIALLRTLLLPNQVLSDADRNYELGLMEHVVGYQRFGVGEGLPAEALVGLKNGWFPYDSGWGINSAGFVMLGNTEYLLAIQTGDNPNQQYGRDTVSTLSALIWRAEHRLAGRPAN